MQRARLQWGAGGGSRRTVPVVIVGGHRRRDTQQQPHAGEGEHAARHPAGDGEVGSAVSKAARAVPRIYD